MKSHIRKTAIGLRSFVGFIALCASFGWAQTYEQIKSFGHELNNPQKLIEGTDGAFYGFTYDRIVKLSKDGSEPSVLFRLTNSGPAGIGLTDLVEGKDHKLYGVTTSSGQR